VATRSSRRTKPLPKDKGLPVVVLHNYSDD
jgi:hypothetical protein